MPKAEASEEVDPAFRELNTRLGEAREEIRRAADKGWEAWDAGQQKAQQSVEALQRSVGEAAEHLWRAGPGLALIRPGALRTFSRRPDLSTHIHGKI